MNHVKNVDRDASQQLYTARLLERCSHRQQCGCQDDHTPTDRFIRLAHTEDARQLPSPQQDRYSQDLALAHSNGLGCRLIGIHGENRLCNMNGFPKPRPPPF